jgi:fructose-1,6-bisphosphatase/inositol monophosphatase family enzyme
MTLPHGTREADCRWRLLVDPIDGTRGLMYQKRSAWILTGVAPNGGPRTRLRDIVLAVQTEIPLVKQHLSDQLWAVRGEGVEAMRYDRLTAASRPIQLHPSRAVTLAHGFASVTRFFPGGRDILAAIDDEVAMALLGSAASGEVPCFEDQYLSTGGQLYELMAGHDRYIADIRPLVNEVLASRGERPTHCCHPYDLCTVLIAQELGILVTDAAGTPIDAPFDVESDVAWVGYSNDALRSCVEPALRAALQRRGLLPGPLTSDRKEHARAES